MHEIVQASRGFQLLNTYHFNHQIKCVAQQASEAVGVFYNIGSDNVACVCPYKQHELQSRCSTENNISALIYVKKYRLYVASCPDLALRIYGEHFELIDTVHVTTTVLSLVFNESTSELYTGSVGCIDTWKLRHQYHNPLIPSTALTCSIQKQQWIVALDIDFCSEKLVATCRDAVYIIDTQTYKQINSFSNSHRGSLTSSVLIDYLGYLITAAKDGTIKVWNCILHNEIHTFAGHVKAITGLKADPSVPCVISCSVDGSVRIWHLENMTECYRMDCGEELLGMCGDIPLGNKLACYSHCSLRLWSVSQLETPFATSINSHVVHMTRVEGTMGGFSKRTPTPARILALGEDGAVRLLSPVSGRVIAVLLPMFSSQLLQDVVYSLVEGLLFVLLKTNDVLLCTARVNPCSAVELWYPTSQTKIHCIAKVFCTVECDSGRVTTLVFGGQEDGNIGLLYSSKSSFTMPCPCPAHDGHVIDVIGTCDPITLSTSQENSIATSALVSYGSDNMMNVWVLCLERENTLILRPQMCVLMDLVPVHFKLLDSLVCLTLKDNSLVMFHAHTNRKSDNRLITSSCSFSKLQSLKHQLEDEHTGEVLSLEANTVLGLLITTSKDGHVKVWSKENQLVSEMFFGKELSSACFLKPKGDLLVGFQKNIHVVQAEDYLPTHYLEIARDLPFSDLNEDQLPFDPDLEFWYDSDRIPRLPPQLDERKQYLLDHPSIRTLHPVGSSTKSCDDVVTTTEASGVSLQSRVDSSLARGLSHQYFTGLNEQRRCTRFKRLIPHQVDTCVSPSPSVEETCSTNKMESESSFIAGKSQISQTSSSSFHPTQDAIPPKAVVTPLESPSSKLCIAPDCLIPNSVLRAQIGYVPPIVVQPPLYQPPDVRNKIVAISQEQEDVDGSESCSSSSVLCLDAESSAHMRYNSSEETVTCVSGVLQEELRKERQSTSKDGSKAHLVAAQKRRKSSSESLQSRLESIFNDAAMDEFPSLSFNVTSSKRRKSTSLNSTADMPTNKPTSALQSGKTEHLQQSSSQSKKIESSLIVSPQLGTLNKTQSQRRVSINAPHDIMPTPPGTATIVNISGPESDEHHNHPSTGSDDGSARNSRVSTQHSKNRKYSVSGEGKATSSLDSDTIASLLQKTVCSKPWFPSESLKDGVVTVDSVFEVLLYLVKCSKPAVFIKVNQALLELVQAELLDHSQLTLVSDAIGSRLQDTSNLKTSSSTVIHVRVSALNTLEKIGIATHSVQLAILPFLTDSNTEVSAAAFRALKGVAGVENRAQLHQLLIDMNVLKSVENNEDEVLRDLAQRIRDGVVSVASSNSQLATISVNTKYRTPGTHKHTSLSLQNYYHDAPSHPHSNKHPPLHDIVQTRPHNHRNHRGKHGLLAPLDGRQKKSSLKRRQTEFGLESSTSFSLQSSFSGPSHEGSPHTRRRAKGRDRRMSVPNKMHSDKLQQMIAHNPTTFSQMKPAVQMMLEAYGIKVQCTSSARERRRVSQCDTYVWNEVFPVIKSVASLRPEVHQHMPANTLAHTTHVPRARGQQTAGIQLQEDSHVVCDKGGSVVDTGTQRCYGSGAATPVMVVKLPKITSCRMTQT